MVALGVLAGSLRLPKVLDIYVSDHHFVVSKRSMIVFVLAVIVAPLLAGCGKTRLKQVTPEMF
jgi:hypothetical protein